MTDSFIQLPGDGDGKKTRTIVQNIGGADIHQQVISIADASGEIKSFQQEEWISALGVDVDDAEYYYSGYVKVGSTEWRIKRVNITDFSITWASGSSDAENAWTTRELQVYGALL